MKALLATTAVLGMSLPSLAAVSGGVANYRPEVQMTVEELLSMPGDNRAEVAKKRGGEFLSQLEKLAFSKDEDYRTRWKSLSLVAQIQGPKSEKILKKALKAPEWYMRNAALLAYQSVLPQKANEVAEQLLQDKALVVRSAAVGVLGKSTDSSARESLWSELSNPKNFRKKQSLFIRGQILAVLAQEPLEKEVPLFLKHLNESDSRLHASAIVALEKVTARKFGKKNDSIGEKRELWIKWAKNAPELQ
jgi:hypothetical protein